MTASRHFALKIVSLGFLFFPSACQGEIPTVESLPPAEQRILAKHMSTAIKDGLAPAWIGARVSRIRIYQRVDVNGPAYYEVQLRRQGRPAGYVVLSSAQHDYPVVQWNAAGEPPSAELEKLAAKAKYPIARVLRFGVHIVAESRSGELVAAWPALTPPAALESKPGPEKTTSTASEQPKPSWAARRVELGRAVLRFYSMQTDGIGKQWAALGSASSDPRPPVCQVRDWDSSPRYRQLEPHEAPNGVWYHTGCGPTAWMMLIGWADRRAVVGDPNWAPYWQLVTDGGRMDPFAAERMASATFDPDEAEMTTKMRSLLGTWGEPFHQEGVTEPWRMEHIGRFLDEAGLNGGRLRDWTYSTPTLNTESDRLANFAREKVCSGLPVVLGIGSLEHYALATAWRPDGEFFLNMGWGGSANGWYHEGVYFVGTFEPGDKNVMPPSEIVNAASGQCLDVTDWQKNGIVQQWGCAGGTLNQRWQWRGDFTVVGLNGQCIEAGDLTGNSGPRAHMVDCDGSQAQQWRIGAVKIVGQDDQCLTRTADGRAILSACGSANSEQQWHWWPGGQIATEDGQCLASDAGTLVTKTCSSSLPRDGSESWLFDSLGRLRSLRDMAMDPQRCLAEMRDRPIESLPLNAALSECGLQRTQRWQLRGTLTRQAGGCLAIPTASSLPGTITESCDGSPRQEWIFRVP